MQLGVSQPRAVHPDCSLQCNLCLLDMLAGVLGELCTRQDLHLLQGGFLPSVALYLEGLFGKYNAFAFEILVQGSCF